jgi:hypothetical protein
MSDLSNTSGYISLAVLGIMVCLAGLGVGMRLIAVRMRARVSGRGSLVNPYDPINS